MRDFIAENTKNRVVINCATMDEVKRLKQAIVKEMKKSPLGIKLLGNGELLNKEVDITGFFEFIKNVLLEVDTSDEFDNAIFDCLKHCTYKTTFPINKSLFDEKCIEAREDYYEIIISCIEENLKPFMLSLVSMWKTRISQTDVVQELSQMLVMTK